MKPLDQLIRNPYLIFLIDGIGALVTALSLIVILPNWDLIQMPADMLHLLGGIAVVFATYSLSNYFFQFTRINLLIRVIAISNLFYCSLSGIIIVQLSRNLSIYDFIYFTGEITIVLTLAFVELKVANKI